jgi:hypothetical protein
MRSRLPLVIVALVLVLPASTAFARPADEPKDFLAAAHATHSSPAPVPSVDDSAEPLGYIVVGLGGFALGAAGYARASTVRRSRRAVGA